jgi:polysaccharide pyruvyl transferase WcaK-like protein
MAQMDFVITTRFHAVVLAQVLGLPYVGLWGGEYYRQKMEAAASYSNSPGMVLSISEFTGTFARERLVRLILSASPKGHGIRDCHPHPMP